MKRLDKLIRFEAVNLTDILIHLITWGFVLCVLLLLMHTFRTEFRQFFSTLQNRPVEVTVKGGETKIRLDAPVEPQPLAQPIGAARALTNRFEDWDTDVPVEVKIDEFTKGGFSALRDKLSALDPNKKSVLNFVVDAEDWPYYPDTEMLAYLTAAAQKIRYLVFYNANRDFQGFLRMDHAIVGIASSQTEFRNFGSKLTTGEWRSFPNLILPEDAFRQTPTIRQLFEKLESGFSEIPLLENGRLKGILDYATVSRALYSQAN